MSQHVIYEDEELQAIFRPGADDYIAVTFSPMSRYADGDWYWGKPLAEKSDLSVLGFVAKSPNWFPTRNVTAALPAVREVLDRYAIRIGFGSSMGAHAALKHSRRLDLSKALAFAPQVSIDPAVVGPANIFARFYDPARDVDVTIAPRDVIDGASLFFDPRYRPDRDAARMIHAIAPAVQLIPAPNTSHETIRLFLRGLAGKALLDTAAHGDRQDLVALTTRARRASMTRVATLLPPLSARHPALARTIYDRYRPRFAVSELERLLGDYFDCVMKIGDIDGARDIVALAVSLKPPSVGVRKLIAERTALVKRMDPTIRDLEAKLADAPSEPAIALALLEKLLDIGDSAGAESLIASLVERGHRDIVGFLIRDFGIKLVDAAPDFARTFLARFADLVVPETRTMRTIAFMFMKLEDRPALLAWSRKAAEHEPGNPFVLQDLAVAYHRNGDAPNALDTIDRALRLKPANDAFLRTRASFQSG